MELAFFVGLAVAFGGAILLASGSELQSRAVYRACGRWSEFLRSPRWLLGLLLLGVAISTNFIALSLTPVSAVQAMSVVALAASATFGSLTGGVEMTRKGTVSVFLCILGILGFIVLLWASPNETDRARYFDNLKHLVVVTTILAVLAGVGLTTILYPRTIRSTTTPPAKSSHATSTLRLVAGAMIFGSITTVFKTLVTLVQEHGWRSTFVTPSTLFALGAVVVGGFVANVLLQRSHRVFPASVVVAALTIIDPLTAAVVGITVLSEVELSPPAALGVIICGGIACAGVAGVTRLHRIQGTPRPTSVPTDDSAPRR